MSEILLYLSGSRSRCASVVSILKGMLILILQGASWRVINIMIDPQETPTWLIEGALSAESNNGMYIMLFRTSAGHIYSSESYNDGMHWTPARRTQLPNPNAKVRSRYRGRYIPSALTLILVQKNVW